MGRNNQDGSGFITKRIKAKLNAVPASQPWIWISRQLMQSGALRSLSPNARRTHDRILLEHMHHAGQENGRLKVTWNDFVKFGISRKFIKPALDELIAVGLIAIEQQGRKAWGEYQGEPTQFRLTHLPVAEPNNFRPATNEWKKFEDSIQAAKAASGGAKHKHSNPKPNGKTEAWTMP